MKFMSLETISLKKRSMHVLRSTKSTAIISTRPNHDRVCRVHIFTINGMLHYTSNDIFLVEQSLCTSRRVMRLFQWGLPKAALIRFFFVPILNEHVVAFRAVLFTLVPIRTLYVGS